MSCPICNNTEPIEGAETCPQCGSDLEVFTHIESAQKDYRFQKKSIVILAALLGIVALSWGMAGILNPDQQVVNADAAIKEEVSPSDDVAILSPAVSANESAEALKKENDELKSEIASLTSEINKLKKPAPSATAAPSTKGEDKDNSSLSRRDSFGAGGGQSNVIIHVVKRGESLWKISRKYFMNGTKAKKIAADNNITNLKAIRIGTKLKIYK